MASQPDDELPQINEMLIQLDLLLGRVFDHKPTWKPTPEESAFMEDVCQSHRPAPSATGPEIDDRRRRLSPCGEVQSGADGAPHRR